ncbi:MAG: SAM-dependent methyltransferase [Candidatus Bathyarchaeia archaeon]
MSGDEETDDFNERLSGWHYSLGWGNGVESVAPYVPTPERVVDYMLKVAGVGPDDVLYDLGCGDGRILFKAIEDFSVDRAVGYELKPNLVEGVGKRIKEGRLHDRVEVHNLNFFEADLSEASVVTLYLTTSGNSKLRSKFREELRPGTRIVSHDFPIQEWEAIEQEDSPYKLGSHKVYLYVIPEDWSRVTLFTKKSSWEKIRERILGE